MNLQAEHRGSGTDVALIEAARVGDADAFATLFRLYRRRIYTFARCYFAPGCDRDDLAQEATIGFFKAVRDFKEDRGAFTTFVDLCVRRQVITFIKTATRQKHVALNQAMSIDAPLFEDSDETLLSRLPAGNDRGDFDEVSDAVVFLSTLWQRCSNLERGILSVYTRGYSFAEMARELGVNLKAVDCAIWRVKVKARKLLDEQRFSSLAIRLSPKNERRSA